MPEIINNLLVKQLQIRNDFLSSLNGDLIFNGSPLAFDSEVVKLTGGQSISGLKEFDEANIYSGKIQVNSLDSELRVLKDLNNLSVLNWEDGTLRTGTTLLNIETSLDWKNREFFGSWRYSGPLTISDTTSGGVLFKIEGANGVLFQVNDDLSSSLLSINDISGLPVLDVTDDLISLERDTSINGSLTLGATDILNTNTVKPIGTTLLVDGLLDVVGAVNLQSTLVVDDDITSTMGDVNAVGGNFSGNVLIGTTIDTGERLQVFGNTFLDGDLDVDNNIYAFGGNFSGNLAVDTDVLFVDASTNKVGINNPSPTYTLDVVGSGKFTNSLQTGGLNITGLSSFVGAFYLNGTGWEGTIKFEGTNGGNGEGLEWKTSTNTRHPFLWFPGNNVVQLTNRASNGVVQIGASNATEGAAGENIIAEFSNTSATIDGDIYLTGTLESGTVPWARLSNHPTITANGGLTGGGDLSISRTISIADSGVTNAKLNDGSVTNAKVSTNAAIAKSKISTTGTWPDADIPTTVARLGSLSGQVRSNSDLDIRYSPIGHNHSGTYLEEVAWGDITGTLTSQTDLQDALDLKLDLESSATHTKSTGWYRIASNPGNRAMARVVMRETQSGKHQYVQFIAGIHYGNNPIITILSQSSYSSGSIEKIRIVSNGTYDDNFLEVYVNGASVSGLKHEMYENIQSTGWILEDWTAGSIPVGYSTLEITIADATAINTTGSIKTASSLEVVGDTTLKGDLIANGVGALALFADAYVDNELLVGGSSVTSSYIGNWNTAHTNSHTHSNKANLDVINQNLGTSHSPLFNNLSIGGANSGLRPDKYLSVITPTLSESVGLHIGNFDGTFNRRFTLQLVSGSSEIQFVQTYSSGGLCDYVWYKVSSEVARLSVNGHLTLAEGVNATTGVFSGNVDAPTFTGNLTGDVTGLASGNLPLTGGTLSNDLAISRNTTATFTVEAVDTGGAPANTAMIELIGYGNRAKGIKIIDPDSPNEWFVGDSYGGASGFSIGKDTNAGGQSQYQSNAIMHISDSGNTIFSGAITATSFIGSLDWSNLTNISIATATESGIVSNTEQIFGGKKTFVGGVKIGADEVGGIINIQSYAGSVRFGYGLTLGLSDVAFSINSDQSINFHGNDVSGADEISANTFVGALTGNASTASVAPAGTLTGTTLNSTVVTSSLTSVGVLNSGSITSGFGNIDIGTSNLTAGVGVFSGDVCIGPVSPSYPLDIFKSGSTATIDGDSTFADTASIRDAGGRGITIGSNTSATYIKTTYTETDLILATRHNPGTGNENLERLRIKANGNVGINISSPQYKLDVTGDGNFSTDLNVGGTLLVGGSSNTTIDSFGIEIYSGGALYSKIGAGTSSYLVGGTPRLGIGTNTPYHHLHALSTGNTEIMSESSSTSSSASIIAKSDGGQIKMVSFCSSRLGNLFGMPQADTGQLYVSSQTFIIGTLSVNDLIFGTNNAERMRITSGGYVGMGTNAPATPLEVSYPSNAANILGANGIGILATRSDAASDAWSATIGLQAYQGKGIRLAGGGFGFNINHWNGTISTELLAIDDSANATFGGNITAGSANFTSDVHTFNTGSGVASSTRGLIISDGTTSGHLVLGRHADYSWIQTFASKPLCINSIGNNVLIGTTSDTGDKLHVNGDIRSTGYKIGIDTVINSARSLIVDSATIQSELHTGYEIERETNSFYILKSGLSFSTPNPIGIYWNHLNSSLNFIDDGITSYIDINVKDIGAVNGNFSNDVTIDGNITANVAGKLAEFAGVEIDEDIEIFGDFKLHGNVTGPLIISDTTSGGVLFRIEGANGTLFSVNDDLSGSLLSINDISGLPVLDVKDGNVEVYGVVTIKPSDEPETPEKGSVVQYVTEVVDGSQRTVTMWNKFDDGASVIVSERIIQD